MNDVARPSKEQRFDFRIEVAWLKWDLPEGIGERPATSAEMYMWAEIERLDKALTSSRDETARACQEYRELLEKHTQLLRASNEPRAVDCTECDAIEVDGRANHQAHCSKYGPSQPPGVLPDQSDVLAWAVRSFGPIAQNVDERAARIAEEAIEIAQVEGVPLDTIKRIADRVYSRPAGERWQEIGGTMIGILSYAEIVGLSMAECTRREFDRVLSKPREWWQKKHAEKVAAGTADLSPCSTATKSGEQP